MMITLRKLPLEVAVAAGVMSAQAMAVDFHGSRNKRTIVRW